MADLSITPANVLKGAGAAVVRGTAGATITAGQTVYYDSASGTYKLADCDSATAALRSPAGLALNDAASGQPLSVAVGGPVTLGAVLTAGTTYYLSGNPGGICPVADLGTGDYPVIIGIASSASVLNVKIQEAGVAI